MKVKKSSEKLIDIIKDEQMADGGFMSYTWPCDKTCDKNSALKTVFSSSLILSCLNNSVDNNIVRHIRPKTAKFLSQQIGRYGTCNYWAKDAKEYKILSYPDDFDDTFCTASALYEYDANLLSKAKIARLVSLLAEYEVQEGGPYKTWIVHDDARPLWKDVDVVVNCNISYFLSLLNIQLPNIKKMIENAISSHMYYSPYYPFEAPIIYFICRWYKGGLTDKLITHILSALPEVNNILEYALLTSSLIRLGYPIRKLEKNINEISCISETEVQAYPFYRGVNPFGTSAIYYAGARALTAAFLLETLMLYDLDRSSLLQKKMNIKNIKPIERIYTSLIEKETNSIHINKQWEDIVKRVHETDTKHPISILPVLFCKSLLPSLKVPDNIVEKLCRVSVYGWIAYTIYDDIYDDHKNIALLPLANVYMRKIISILDSLSLHGDFLQKVCIPILDGMDRAFLYERKSIEKKNMSELFETNMYNNVINKSLGYVLSPLAMLSYLKFSPSSSEYRNTLKVFKNYLIARQISDDIYDWKDDDSCERHTPVSVYIRDQLNQKITEDRNKIIFQSYRTIYDKVLIHLQCALRYIHDTDIFIQKSPLEDMVTSLQASIERSIDNVYESEKFINLYTAM